MIMMTRSTIADRSREFRVHLRSARAKYLWKTCVENIMMDKHGCRKLRSFCFDDEVIDIGLNLYTRGAMHNFAALWVVTVSGWFRTYINRKPLNNIHSNSDRQQACVSHSATVLSLTFHSC